MFRCLIRLLNIYQSCWYSLKTSCKNVFTIKNIKNWIVIKLNFLTLTLTKSIIELGSEIIYWPHWIIGSFPEGDINSAFGNCSICFFFDHF